MMRRILRLGESRPLSFRKDKGIVKIPASGCSPLLGTRERKMCTAPFFSGNSVLSEGVRAAVIRLNDIIDKVASYSDIENEDLDFIKKAYVYSARFTPARKGSRESPT